MTLDKKLNDAFEEMMKYRQSIGYATATYRSSVPPFINFCVKNHPLSARITQEMVDEGLSGVRHHEISIKKIKQS